MKRVLVTGATGFIGRHTLPLLLERGYEVHAVAHRATVPSPGIRWHTVDLLIPDPVASLMEAVKPTHLLHLAWYAEHGKFWTSPKNLDWVAASLHLFQAFVLHGGKRATVGGSCAEYDWSTAEMTEDITPTHPATLYGISKNALREMLQEFSRLSSLSLAWGRIFFLYGLGEHPIRFVASIIASLRADQPIHVKAGLHQRDFMHVEDVAAALVHVLDSPFEGPINIASGETVTLGDVARIARELAGKASLLQIENAPGTPENPRALTADTAKLRSSGFTPRITLREGLKRLIES